MIAGLIRWSARNIFLITLACHLLDVAQPPCLRGIARATSMPFPISPMCRSSSIREYPGQAPQVVEDQVTYPLTTAMLSVPKSRVVRGFSFFGVSFVYIIFEDGTDLYWARSRVLEYLSSAARRLPAGVAPTLGPDATELAGSTNTSCAARRRIGRAANDPGSVRPLWIAKSGAWPRSPASAGSSNNIAS